MKADRARRKPATSSSSEVLPAPDGPKRTVARPRSSALSSSVNGASGREMLLSSRLTSVFSASHQPFARPHRREGQRHRHAEETKRAGVLAELHVLENGQGEG